MKDKFVTNEYDCVRDWIENAHDQYDLDWEKLYLAGKKNESELMDFLAQQRNNNFWPPMTVQEWQEVVSLQKNKEDEVKFLRSMEGAAIIYDYDQNNGVKVPRGKRSCWQLYKKKLLDSDFKEATVGVIEQDTLQILKSLSNDTRNRPPVKGLVIGNVQSGKTANMAALMAMAADCGWNMFIILSGTIDNLRVQTANRLINDLQVPSGNIKWNYLEHLKKGDPNTVKEKMSFETEKYFTVCLKYPSRLSGLIDWLNDLNDKRSQLKIIVIDDEADQAGINTCCDAEKRNRINGLICNLVNGKKSDGTNADSEFGAMNYIGYTATPYANILNECTPDSLYPKNFIAALSVSNEYFGPQQIFGYKSRNVSSKTYKGLKIIEDIKQRDLDVIDEIHKSGCQNKIPDTLKESVIWFLCGVSCMRLWGYKKPISMLIHTSQKTDHHQRVAEVVQALFSNFDCNRNSLLEDASRIWNEKTKKFDIESFHDCYYDYGCSEYVKDYPNFEKLKSGIIEILEGGVSSIQLNEDRELNYHKGIHLCIDNCVNNGINDEGMYVRLAYPRADRMPSPAPAFIVIGGATLSRGLTIEGLISSFFIRSVGQADTLMQMGRWFGYRRGYELIPRIWMTKKTRAQFDYLSELDQELREEIITMSALGRVPSEYAPKVRNSPSLSFIRITAKNKMQGSVEADYDYSGASKQTYLFDNDKNILSSNISVTENFLRSLGKESESEKIDIEHSKNCAIWRNVEFARIKDYLSEFKFQERLKVLGSITTLLEWVENVTNDGKLITWNVVVAGKGTNDNGVWMLPNGRNINKVLRSRKCNDRIDNEILDIGVVRAPKDLLADIEINRISSEKDRKYFIDNFSQIVNKIGEVESFREKAGLDTTPQLLIYRVDKNSKDAKSSEKRQDLNAVEDLIGLSIYIPGGKRGTSYVSRVSINLNEIKYTCFDGNADLEGTDGN